MDRAHSRLLRCRGRLSSPAALSRSLRLLGAPGIPPCSLRRGGDSGSSCAPAHPPALDGAGTAPAEPCLGLAPPWDSGRRSPGPRVTSPARPFHRLGQGWFSLLGFSKAPHQSQPVGSSVSFIYLTMALLNHRNLCGFSPFFPFFLCYFLKRIFSFGGN